MIFRCLFEQSGTFKNEFIKLGYTAYDYARRFIKEYILKGEHNNAII
jgi:hypothetical protein